MTKKGVYIQLKMGSDISYDMRQKYFSVPSAALLFFIAYLNTIIVFKGFSSGIQLIALLPLVVLWFLVVGIRLDAAIFACISLLPSTLLWGVGFLRFPGMAITLSDLFMIIAFCLFLIKPIYLHLTKYTIYLWLLWVVCLASILTSNSPIAHVGQFMRLTLSIALMNIVLGSRGDYLKKPILYGILLWPMIAIANIFGIEELWRFISFSNGLAFNASQTGEALLGGPLAIINLIFLIPLFMYLRASKVAILIIFIWLIVLVIFSYSRSLFIGSFIAILLYLFSGEKWRQRMIIMLPIIALIAGITIVGSFNFTVDGGSKSESTAIRIEKVLATRGSFLANPLLGVGYGDAFVSDSQSSQNQNFNELTDVKASAEFTPSQILAETGFFGGLVSLILFFISVKYIYLVITNHKKPAFLKVVLLCCVVNFICSLLSSNAYNALPFMFAIPLIFNAINWSFKAKIKNNTSAQLRGEITYDN